MLGTCRTPWALSWCNNPLGQNWRLVQETGPADTVASVPKTDRAAFSFRSVDVFDPRRTWISALAVVPLFALLYISPHAGWVVLAVSIAWFFFLAARDAKRQTGVLLRFKSCMLQDIEIDETAALAQIWVDAGDVARVDRTLRRRGPTRLRPGSRVVPLVFGAPSGRTFWIEAGRPIELSGEELRGALSVVLDGGELSCELLVTARTGERPRPRAVMLTSTNGSLQSWDPEGLAVRL